MDDTLPANPGRRPTILLVTSDAHTRETTARLLAQAGYVAVAVEDAARALAIVTRSRPDLLLADLRLSGADGMEGLALLSRLRLDERTFGIPIVLLGAFADAAELTDGLRLGAADFIIKPFQGEELLARVRTQLDLHLTKHALEQQTVALRTANTDLRNHVTNYQRVEKELRENLERADRSRRALLSVFEDQKHAEEARKKMEERVAASQRVEGIGRLAGGVAHDFNNLLSVILGYVDFAVVGLGADTALYRDLLEIRRAGERAAELTKQLLAFSRRQLMCPISLDLNQIALGMNKLLGRILGEDIELVHALAPDLGKTLADPSQVEQVIMNLAVNARDAMPTGGKLIIETANLPLDDPRALGFVSAKPGPHVLLSVSDTGHGMDAQTQAKIFEPFFTTKEKGQGTGLGLSTVHGIVMQSGGDIRVQSQPGQGTTFQICLPQDFSNTQAPARTPPALTNGKGTETILLVEDEPALRKVLRRFLAGQGYFILAAEHGESALHLAANHPGEIHLLLTDVVMPGMSGKELALALAANHPQMKLLFMSGYTDDSLAKHGILDTRTHLLSKPFDMADLSAKIRAVLDHPEN